jgi:DNA-binding response OmpR family regulator
MEPTIYDIVLIEDDPNDTELTIRALKKNNISNNIRVIPDGAEALEFFFATGRYKDRDLSSKPRLVILDLKLPKVSGIEVLRKIKANEQTKVIPVVVLTSSREERDVIESYQLGVNSYIVKPVDFEKFAKSVVELGIYWLLINQPPVWNFSAEPEKRCRLWRKPCGSSSLKMLPPMWNC